MTTLAGRRILVGVTGGIAAYKAADLVRRLREWQAEVQVVMTEAATTFVAPLTFQAVSGRAVRLALLDPAAEAGMGHIELARWADLILIAPASADFLARLAHGMANDLLSTLCLAADVPIAVAPAMNRLMWANPATRHNARLLAERGISLWGPGEGDQACGEVGAGRMLEPLDLRERAASFLAGGNGTLAGLRVLITAGPTREPIDPVRYISNRSTGRMGFAVADAARRAGATVTVVSGPVNLPTLSGVARVDVESAGQMLDAVLSRVTDADIFIATAAVADYRAATPVDHKVKKTHETLALDLVRNPDILATVADLPEPPFTVGFAAETHDVLRYAEDKRRRKKLDMIAANQVGQAGSGFEAEDNALHVLWEGGGREFGLRGKAELGELLVEVIAERYRLARGTAP